MSAPTEMALTPVAATLPIVCSVMPPLAADDPLLAYLERGLDAYDGLARDVRLKSLAA